MDIIEVLLNDHENLRRRARALEEGLGPERGAGRDDQSDCDMQWFCFASGELLKELLAHEEREEEALGELWARRGRRPEIDRYFLKSHRTLNQLTGLLRTAAECCDGRHVYSVRTVASRLREALESHLAEEERDVFPLVRRPHGRQALIE